MGRLAGPINDAWKKQVRERRRYKTLIAGRVSIVAPILHPTKKRRVMALLWFIGEHSGGTILVGFSGRPPLTKDMRMLLADGYLEITREPPMIAGPYGPVKTKTWQRVNALSITPLGISALGAAKISSLDKQYIVAAGQSASLC